MKLLRLIFLLGAMAGFPCIPLHLEADHHHPSDCSHANGSGCCGCGHHHVAAVEHFPISIFVTTTVDRLSSVSPLFPPTIFVEALFQPPRA